MTLEAKFEIMYTPKNELSYAGSERKNFDSKEDAQEYANSQIPIRFGNVASNYRAIVKKVGPYVYKNS